ncbi:MAG: hypothetical protein V1859_04825 [archaeon]
MTTPTPTFKVVNPIYRNCNNRFFVRIFSYDFWFPANITKVMTEITNTLTVKPFVRFAKDAPLSPLGIADYNQNIAYLGFRNYFSLSIAFPNLQFHWDAIYIEFTLNGKTEAVTLLNKLFNTPPLIPFGVTVVSPHYHDKKKQLVKIFTHEPLILYASGFGGPGYYDYSGIILDGTKSYFMFDTEPLKAVDFVQFAFFPNRNMTVQLYGGNQTPKSAIFPILNPSLKHTIEVTTNMLNMIQQSGKISFLPAGKIDGQDAVAKQRIEVILIDKISISKIKTGINESAKGVVPTIIGGIESQIMIFGEFVDMIRGANVFLHNKICSEVSCSAAHPNKYPISNKHCTECGKSAIVDLITSIKLPDDNIKISVPDKCILATIPNTIASNEYLIVVEPITVSVPSSGNFTTSTTPDLTKNTNVLKIGAQPSIKSSVKLFYGTSPISEYVTSSPGTLFEMPVAKPDLILQFAHPSGVNFTQVDCKVKHGYSPTYDQITLHEQIIPNHKSYKFSLHLLPQETADIAVTIKYKFGSAPENTINIPYKLHSSVISNLPAIITALKSFVYIQPPSIGLPYAIGAKMMDYVKEYYKIYEPHLAYLKGNAINTRMLDIINNGLLIPTGVNKGNIRPPLISEKYLNLFFYYILILIYVQNNPCNGIISPGLFANIKKMLTASKLSNKNEHFSLNYGLFAVKANF